MVIQYTLKFKGDINRTFKFEVHCDEWGNDMLRYVEEKPDGYLYIQGYRITNIPDSKHTILKNLSYNASRNVSKGYVDSEFSVNLYGTIVCTRHYYGDNILDRGFSKFARLFGVD